VRERREEGRKWKGEKEEEEGGKSRVKRERGKRKR